MVAVAVPNWPADPSTPRRVTLRRVGVVRSRRVFWLRRLLALALLTAIVTAMWIAVVATLGWIGGGPLTAAGQPGGTHPPAQRVWVVRPGDTLWVIAQSTGDHGDLRPLVDRLSSETGGRPLQPGQRLVLSSS